MLDWVFLLSKDRRLGPLAHSDVNIQSSKVTCAFLLHHHRHRHLPAPASDPLPGVSQAHVLKGITSFGILLILHSFFPILHYYKQSPAAFRFCFAV